MDRGNGRRGTAVAAVPELQIQSLQLSSLSTSRAETTSDAGKQLADSDPSTDTYAPTEAGANCHPPVPALEQIIDDTAVQQLMVRFPQLLRHQLYERGTTKCRLVEMLNKLFARGRVPRGRCRDKVSRKHLSDHFGLSHAAIVQYKEILEDYDAVLQTVEPLDSVPNRRFGAQIPADGEEPSDDEARQVVARYPGLYSHQFYPAGGNAHRIVSLLNKQIVSDTIVRSRGGLISRKLLREQAGLQGGTAIVPYLGIVEDYQRAIGGVESVHEAKIPAMRVWLEQHMADGTLEIRDQQISRGQLFTAFDLGSNSLVLLRYPRIAALVKEFDAKVRDSGYRPSEIQGQLKALRLLLANDPPMDKDSPRVSKKAVEKQLGLASGMVSRSPFANAISDAERDIRRLLEEDSLVSLLCGRVFKFRVLVDQGWSEKVAVGVKESFERHYRNKKKEDAKTLFYTIANLFEAVSASGSLACREMRIGLNSRAPMTSLSKYWTLATQEFRSALYEKHSIIETVNNAISSTNVVMRNLANDGVVPVLALPLVQYREDNPSHLPSVAEVTPETGTERGSSRVDDYLRFATSMLEQAGKTYEIDIISSDQGDFTRVLRDELEREKFTAAENPASVITRVLTRRLKLLEEAAIKVLSKAKSDWEFGQALCERGEDPGDDWDLLFDRNLNRYERTQLLRKHFPNDESEKDQGIANLLATVVQRYGLIYPSNAPNGRPEGQFFQKRANEFGGATILQSYLTPSTEAVAAAITLYLLASGSNVSVGRGLHLDCIEACEEPHHSKITGYKSRANGKPIFVTLEDRSEAVRSIRWLQIATKDLRDANRFEDEGQLFVSRGKGEEFKVMEEWTYRSSFKDLVASIPELADLPITPNMLRPSILLKACLESDGRTRLSQAIGQHGSGVHQGYVNKLPYRFMHDVSIMHYTVQMETVVISRVEDAHGFLGVDAEGFERRVEAVMKTGLGTMCADRHGRPGNEGEICKSMDCWDNCPQLIVIARKEDIAILQVWQHSLRLVEGDWVRDQPERWANVWLPWLTFVNVVEEKMRQSAQFAGVWRDASVLSSKLMTHPSFKPMRLF